MKPAREIIAEAFIYPAENHVSATSADLILRALDAAGYAVVPRGRARYERAPEADKRVSRGDDFSGDAWRDTHSGNEIVWKAVGFNPNRASIRPPHEQKE